MRKKFILFLLCAAAWAQQDVHLLGAHAPQVMQKTGNVTTSGTTVTATLTPSPSPNVTAATGTTLIAVCAVNNTGTIAVSDNNSNTWNTAKSQTGTVAGVLISFVPAPNSGATTVTCTAGTTGVVAVQLYEVFGFLAQVEAQPDSTDSNTASAQTSALLSAAGLTQQAPNEIAIVGLMLTTNNACTAASGWTIDTQQAATGGRLCPARQALPGLNGVAGSNSVATFTSASYALAAAAFKPITIPISGIVKANIQTNAPINEAQVAGNTVSVNNGTADTGTQRVTLASDSTGQVVPAPTTASGDAVSACNVLSAASTNSTSCKGSAGNFYGFEIFNTTTTIYYLRLYNSASAPTCSSATGFIRTIPIPPASAAGGAGGAISNQVFPVNFGTGIGYCLTGGSSSTDNTNAATGVFGEIRYK